MLPWRFSVGSSTLITSTLLLIATTLLWRNVIADADFDSVRVKYDYEDKSGRAGDPKEKYWRELPPFIFWLDSLLTHFSSTDESMYEHPSIAQGNVLICTEASIHIMTAGQGTLSPCNPFFDSRDQVHRPHASLQPTTDESLVACAVILAFHGRFGC